MGQESTPPRKDKTNGILSKIASTFGRRIANRLSQRFEPLSLRTKKTVLICFGLAVTLACGSMIIRPFINNDSALTNLLPKGIEMPHLRSAPDNIFSEEDYLLLMGFKRTLDSLETYDPEVYHQMTQGRQGLLDSIDYLLGIYGKLKE